MYQDFTQTIVVAGTAQDVFHAITQCIPAWWSKVFEGASSKIADQFTVRFGLTFKTMCIEEIENDKKIVWRCIDQHLEMPEGLKPLPNAKEWVGNRLVWLIETKGSQTILHFKHEGLTPEAACWSICEQGWDQTLLSLVYLLKTGKGKPFVELDEAHLEKAKGNRVDL